jgi:hypothetical protein
VLRNSQFTFTASLYAQIVESIDVLQTSIEKTIFSSINILSDGSKIDYTQGAIGIERGEEIKIVGVVLENGWYYSNDVYPMFLHIIGYTDEDVPYNVEITDCRVSNNTMISTKVVGYFDLTTPLLYALCSDYANVSHVNNQIIVSLIKRFSG